MFKGQTIMPLNIIWHINCLDFCYNSKRVIIYSGEI